MSCLPYERKKQLWVWPVCLGLPPPWLIHQSTDSTWSNKLSDPCPLCLSPWSDRRNQLTSIINESVIDWSTLEENIAAATTWAAITCCLPPGNLMTLLRRQVVRPLRVRHNARWQRPISTACCVHGQDVISNLSRPLVVLCRIKARKPIYRQTSFPSETEEENSRREADSVLDRDQKISSSSSLKSIARQQTKPFDSSSFCVCVCPLSSPPNESSKASKCFIFFSAGHLTGYISLSRLIVSRHRVNLASCSWIIVVPYSHLVNLHCTLTFSVSPGERMRAAGLPSEHLALNWPSSILSDSAGASARRWRGASHFCQRLSRSVLLFYQEVMTFFLLLFSQTVTSWKEKLNDFDQKEKSKFS